MTIRRRILTTFTLIVLIGSLVQLLIAGSQLQAATLEFFRHRLETDALIASASLGESSADGENGASAQPTLARIQQQVGHDFFLLNARGSIIAYGGGISFQDTFLDKPEFIQAQQGELGYDVRVDAHGNPRMYVATPIRYETSIVGYMILSQPMTPVDDEVQNRWIGLIFATLPVIGLVIVASLWISTSISRPIQKLRNSALKMAEGSFDTRIDAHSRDEVGELAHAFNYMAEQIEKLMKTQRSFVSNAAHELRNPLMTLRLRIEALQDSSLPQTRHDIYLKELMQEVTYLSDLVGALLVLARVDEGRYQPGEAVYDGAALLHDIARHWRIEAKQVQLNFEAQIAPDLPDFPIPANDLRLVLDNLLSNAVKYTPQGSITLRAWCEAGTIKLQVADTGQGFAAEEAEHLFDRFYRAPGAREKQIPGTGLGLSIVQAVLEYHHVRIEARSAGIGKGATFTVALPT